MHPDLILKRKERHFCSKDTKKYKNIDRKIAKCNILPQMSYFSLSWLYLVSVFLLSILFLLKLERKKHIIMFTAQKRQWFIYLCLYHLNKYLMCASSILLLQKMIARFMVYKAQAVYPIFVPNLQGNGN